MIEGYVTRHAYLNLSLTIKYINVNRFNLITGVIEFNFGGSYIRSRWNETTKMFDIEVNKRDIEYKAPLTGKATLSYHHDLSCWSNIFALTISS